MLHNAGVEIIFELLHSLRYNGSYEIFMPRYSMAMLFCNANPRLQALREKSRDNARPDKHTRGLSMHFCDQINWPNYQDPTIVWLRPISPIDYFDPRRLAVTRANQIARPFETELYVRINDRGLWITRGGNLPSPKCFSSHLLNKNHILFVRSSQLVRNVVFSWIRVKLFIMQNFTLRQRNVSLCGVSLIGVSFRRQKSMISNQHSV